MMRRGSAVPMLLMCAATVAYPCGGSQSYSVDGPLVSATGFAERAISPIREYEAFQRPELRFLPGLIRADRVRFAALVGRSPLLARWWDTVPRPLIAEPDRRAMLAAWARGDHEAAVREAHRVVERVMALPTSDDAARDSALRLAVETIELAPAVASEPITLRQAAFSRLAAPFRAQPIDSMPAVLQRNPTTPRRASAEYVALRLAMRDRIPDDTREEILKRVPLALWDSLHLAHRMWLERNSGHPYAGLMKFARLRLFFLASQPDSAWRTAVALYRDYPVRAGAEMSYLLQVGFLPPERLLTDAAVPPELRAALVGNVKPTPSVRQSLMQLATANRQAPWADGLEERLLATFAQQANPSRQVPAGFPAWRASASPFWRYMWALSMLRAGRVDDAVRFTAIAINPRDDSLLYEPAAMLAARIHITRNDWAAALQVPHVDMWTKRYLLRVLAPDSTARQLTGARDASLAREARLVLAARAAHAGKWDDAAGIVRPIDVARASRYTRIGVLSRDTASNAGVLRFATALAAANGQLFFEATRYFYRGMMIRDYALGPDDTSEPWDLPWTRDDERRRMYDYLRGSSERYLALQSYASFLARPGVTSSQRKAAVRDADQVYRALLATDPSRSDSGFWGDSLPASHEARAIRRAGRS